MRSRKERDTLASARERSCRKRVAILLGARYRGRKAQRRFRELKCRRKQLLVSSLRLQCAFRCRLARKRLNRQREKQWLTVAPRASKTIQRRWRGVRGRRKAEQRREEKRLQHQRQVGACTTLQSWSRMLHAKRIKLRLLCEWFTSELNRFRSAIIIQSAWRIRQSVEMSKALEADYLAKLEIQRASALRVQAQFRVAMFRKVLRFRAARTRKRFECTLTIQQWYRDQQDRILRNLIAAQQLAENRLGASELIQRKVRQRHAYLQLVVLRRERDDLIALKEDKGAIISHWARICAAKMYVQRQRIEFEEDIRRAMQLKKWASSIISAGWRGKLGRDKAKKCRIIRAQRWKALWDEGESRAFYYNQNTGQTSWQKPQCLLDLEPKPVCNNCNSLLAEIECRECCEHYCTECFQFIHLGGRRSQHSYRLVYDFYGRRKDYDMEPWLSPSLGVDQNNADC